MVSCLDCGDAGESEVISSGRVKPCRFFAVFGAYTCMIQSSQGRCSCQERTTSPPGVRKVAVSPIESAATGSATENGPSKFAAASSLAM